MVVQRDTHPKLHVTAHSIQSPQLAY